MGSTEAEPVERGAADLAGIASAARQARRSRVVATVGQSVIHARAHIRARMITSLLSVSSGA